MGSWGLLAGLGAFHGINPAMGWLFAVALGLQQRSRTAVLRALPPIALGHALSIAAVLAVVTFAGLVLDARELRVGAALVLFAFAAYRLAARHGARAGMQVGFRDLTLWSFIMASGHGAGLMLLPVLLGLAASGPHAEHLREAGLSPLAPSLGTAAAIIAVHTAAMLAVGGAIALAVFEWVGLAFLRRSWINFDLLWSIALGVAGAIIGFSALV